MNFVKTFFFFALSCFYFRGGFFCYKLKFRFQLGIFVAYYTRVYKYTKIISTSGVLKLFEGVLKNALGSSPITFSKLATRWR